MSAVALHLDETHYAYWRDEICAIAFGANPPSLRPGRFGHTIRVADTPDGQLYSVQNHGDAYSLDRTRKTIDAAGHPPRWGLGIGCSGRLVNTVRGGKSLVMARGELLLLHCDTTMVATTHADTEFGLVMVPDHIAAVLCSSSVSWPEAKLESRTGLGRILSDYVLSLFAQLPSLGAPALQSLVPSILPLLDAVVAPTRHSIEGAQATVRMTQRRRMFAFIDSHLADSRLNAAWIAAAFRVSVRYVHALFAETECTVGETILARRLDRCLEALRDGRFAHQSVTEIALRWGFNDASHFSRAFRRRFDVTPRDARSAGPLHQKP